MRFLPLAYLAIAILPAQTPVSPDWQTAAGVKMAFDVASVKPTKSPRLPNFPLNNGNAKTPGGHLAASFSLGDYIQFAYKLEPSQWSAVRTQLPKWANDNYAIDAEAEGNPTKDQMRLMMQSLLADRFKLKVHFETREVPVLALVLVKPDKFGPRLIRHSEGPPCPDSFEMLKLPPPGTPPPPLPKPSDVWPPQCGTSALFMATSERTRIGSRNTSLALAAEDIYLYGSQFGELDRPVVDQTGLEGTFDFSLELPAGMSPFSLVPKQPNPDDDPKGTPFLNAVRQQLGLKLERSKGEVRTLIIDQVEPPSEN
ncbi:MAG TPA: TIGR03435 family protein [Bryobacteraceae bacterium]|nr:TIGR03435 family protein [Bryobacteraceae bacterium]